MSARRRGPRGYLARLERRRRLLRRRETQRREIPAARRRKVGLPPGTVVHTGTRFMDEPTIDLMHYDGDGVSEERGATLERALAARDEARAAGRTLWIDVKGLHDTELIEALGHAFELHPLTLEDVASVGQRPKFEGYDGYLFVTARMLSLRGALDPDGAAPPSGSPSGSQREPRREPRRTSADDAETVLRLDNEQLSLVIAPGVLLTFQERPGDVFAPVRDRLRAGKGRIRRRGADYLAYALLDVLIDATFGILEHYGDEAEALEDAVFDDPRPALLHELQRLRRDALELRRAVWPLRDLLSAMARDEGGLIDEAVRTFLRDALDHAVQAIDAVETLRELLSGLHDGYLSGVSHRMNEVMKVLTIIATIFIPLTFIAGIYGMNFEHMPELGWRWSYPLLWLVMLTLGGAMVAWFRRRGWL